MRMTASTLRRSLYVTFAGCALGAGALALPSATTAAPDPCAASNIAKTIGTVSMNTGTYLDQHPETNAALTTASKQQGPAALGGVKNYLDANPQAAKELGDIQKPLQTLGSQCDLPITLPQVLQMLQGAQQSGQLPQLPGNPAPSPLTSTGTLPGSPAVSPATGPLPGPAPGTVR